MEEKLNVELISESEGRFECALVDEEGNEKHKFTLELSEEDLLDMTADLHYIEEITSTALYKRLKQEIIILIMEKCSEFSEYVNYEHMRIYDNFAAGDIASSLSNWIEQRVYDYFNNIYSLNNEQLEEMKKLYDEGIDLNLVIKRTGKSAFIGSRMLSAEEMKEIRVSKEEEWKNMRNNGFRENIKFEGTIVHKQEQKDENITQKGKEIYED